MRLALTLSFWPRLLLGLLVLVVLQSAPAADGPVTGDEARAAALSNLVAFTDWPASAFASPDAPLVVGIMAPPGMVKLVRELLDRETWRGRPIVLRPVSSPTEANGCHVLYVARANQARWRTQQPDLKGRPILSVGEGDRFAALGGIVQLGLERNRLRLTVNLSAARAVGLVLSSKVLRLAHVIEEPAR
jgi:hypothetical protein